VKMTFFAFRGVKSHGWTFYDPTNNMRQEEPMAMAEVSVVPLGTGSASLSKYIAECVKAMDEAGIKYTLTPMGTVIEGSVEEILETVRMIHRIPLNHGASRVLTRVVIDERRDKDATAQQKVESVKKRLEKSKQ